MKTNKYCWNCRFYKDFGEEACIGCIPERKGWLPTNTEEAQRNAKESRRIWLRK